MITFKINSKPYPIPTQWSDVTYSQYVELIRSKSLTDQISIFTGISRESLRQAELKNLENIARALAFINYPPKFDRTNTVGPYHIPKDVKIWYVGQFEDLRGLMLKLPTDLSTIENVESFSDLCLQASAIYCQRLRDGVYDWENRIESMMDELKAYSCVEVIGNGSFFLSKPKSMFKPITNPFQRLILRLKSWRQG